MIGSAPGQPLLTTYRFQLHEGFGFDDVRRLLPYLRRLGVSHLYLSPVFEARAGSTHGYDATDTTAVRAALGGRAGFHALVTEARAAGLGIMLDIVPNHMAASEQNVWLRDVLTYGADSAFVDYFDLTWRADPGTRRIVLPILGRPVEEAVAAGEIALVEDADGPALRYFERRLPIDPRTWPHDDRNGDTAGTVRALLDRQHYELAFWRDVDRRLTYRRFFDVIGLIGVRVEDHAVFAATHALVLDWIAAGAVTALRIDHVDGLLDPTGYLQRLREACDARSAPGSVPIVVEKILAHDEPLPDAWPADGTTGYDFLNAVNGLFIDPAGLSRVTEGYRRQTGVTGEFPDIVHVKKKQVLAQLFAAEWSVLTRELGELAAAWPEPPAALAAALLEVTACLRVYRTYTRVTGAVSGADRQRIADAVDHARRRAPTLDRAALARVAALLGLDPDGIAPVDATDALRWLMRWQQVSGPAMAKGLEDTALYTFYPLAAANDVGGEPDHAVRDTDALHAFLAARARTPRTMNATSTHDTKRAEDVRARLDVLSEIPDAWLDAVTRWRALNAPHRAGGAPDANEEWLIYQTIVGAWPLHEEPGEDFADRIRSYMEKALREAKHHTSWLAPDAAYERAVADFVGRILDPAASGEFLADVRGMVERIRPHGVVNALAQVAIKAWAPGVADFYQGTESWTLDLVDPDNRRPVDFGARAVALESAVSLLDAADPEQLAALLDDPADGGIKVHVTAAALRERADAAALFASGGYLPLAAEGPRAPHLFAFARTGHDEDWRLLVAPRLTVTLGRRLTGETWRHTRVRLPEAAPAHWLEVLAGRTIDAADGTLPVDVLFRTVPLALLRPLPR
jgi:(1->4)-alpha-D-glucan 1-alpha-D-glucosylmutase